MLDKIVVIMHTTTSRKGISIKISEFCILYRLGVYEESGKLSYRKLTQEFFRKVISCLPFYLTALRKVISRIIEWKQKPVSNCNRSLGCFSNFFARSLGLSRQQTCSNLAIIIRIKFFRASKKMKNIQCLVSWVIIYGRPGNLLLLKLLY